jgi:methylglutaconyl-CoA hydratase
MGDPIAEPVIHEFDDGVATLTLNQPSSRNALSNPLLNALGDHLVATSSDPTCRVVVLTNTGPVFCAGANVKGDDGGEVLRFSLPEILTMLLDHPRPVVGRISGHCLGGGVGLAAACDISIADGAARFGFTEVRLGVAPAIISVVCLPKMRSGDAMALFLSGQQITAARAAEVGLITSAVDGSGLDEAVSRWCDLLRLGGPDALAAAKRLVRAVPSLARDEAFEWTAALSQELFASDEGREGLAAFRERRPPSWS